MYKVLVTNDDGINSTGIKAMVKALSKLATVYVAAPRDEQSGKSRSLTFLTTIEAKEVEFEGAEVAYAVAGTPTDCVIWALSKFEGLVDFDYVFSGINLGENSSTAVYYSATIAGALEGSMHGIRSLALSVEGHDTENFDYICGMIPELIKQSNRFDSNVILNVNAPDLPADMVKGVRITDIASPSSRPQFVFNDAGEDKYQMSVRVPDFKLNGEEDFSCLREGYVSLTPLCPDMSCPSAKNILKGFAAEGDLCLFIGVQEGALGTVRKAARFEENISKYVRCVSRLDMPVMIVNHVGKGACIPAVENATDIAERVELISFNAFESEEFAALAEAVTSRRVFIAGLETHISVQQTAMEFLKRGFEVYIVENCCSASSKEDHKIAIEGMRVAGCIITSCEAAVMQMLGGSSHSAYRSIMGILEN